MRTKFIAVMVTIGIACGVGWYGFAVEVPSEDLANVAPNSVLTSAKVNEIIARLNTLRALVNAEITPTPQIIPVDCGAGQTIAQALQEAREGDTIQITGTCDETVTMRLDDITLDGQGSAILDGGGGSQAVITIDGARRVTIQGLTVQNGDDGIHGKRGASFTVRDVTARRNADDGIKAGANAAAEIIDCSAEDNGDDGFVVGRSASASFRGTITSTGNAGDGMEVYFSASAVFAAGAMVSANNNGNSTTFGSRTFDGVAGGDGIRVVDASQLIVSPNSTVEARNNVDDGIAVARASTVDAFGTAEAGPVSITVDGNADGVHVHRVANFEIFGTQATLNVRNNAHRGLSASSTSDIGCYHATVINTGNGDPDSTGNGGCG